MTKESLMQTQRLSKQVGLVASSRGIFSQPVIFQGQTYEKKSKKKATDAGEEHARYINLISTLGPEVSQEK